MIIEGISCFDNSPIAVEIEDKLIKNITRLPELSKNSKPYFIAPGLIDIQVNGYLSVSFSFEGADETAENNELSISDCKKVTEALWKEGVTSYFPTLTTNSRELLLKNFEILAGAKDDPSLLGSVPGFHLEGPYISPVDGYRGAHPKEHVRQPDWNEFMEFYHASGDGILLVTIAPEVPGAMEFIRECRMKGIAISLGHHNGSSEEVKAAADNGAGLSTHLGNGCASFINRHKNPIWPQLADERLMASIICDGFHLPAEVIQVFYKVKGAHNIILTSDITNFAGLPPGEYRNKKGETIIKTQDGHLKFSGQEGGLYGSATLLSEGVGHIMKVTGCSLSKAIRMVTLNPARLLNMNDRGKLEPGRRADIILFSMHDFEMKIKKTIVAGKTVFQED